MQIKNILEQAQAATAVMNEVTDAQVVEVLQRLASKTLEHADVLLAENKKDLERMDPANPKYDRLMLTKERLESIATDLINVSKLPNPVGKVLDKKIMPNGMEISKVSVPLGVIGIIYEARPNVTFDCFALAIKSGNVVVLKGGSDAVYSNTAIVSLIQEVLQFYGILPQIVQLLPVEREATEELLRANGYVDILIPRGSQTLIDYVRQHATVPVIETGAGIVHVYVDETCDADVAVKVVYNSKTRRVSVCNALDCLVIHKNSLPVLPRIVKPLAEKNVLIYADDASKSVLEGVYPSSLLERADDASYGTEFLDYKMAIKTVDSLENALEHIRKYSSKHSESIVTTNMAHAETFVRQVDAAAVYVNVSTAFTDGAQFGMGAEIGISTQKLHARGPMALPELTTYKYVVRGNGQTRP